MPTDKPDWLPHPKSMPLGYLAVHLSMLPNWVNRVLEKDELDVGAMQTSRCDKRLMHRLHLAELRLAR